MSIFDKMMETDFKKLAEKEQAKMKVKRLSKVFGEPFVVLCKPISQKQLVYVAENAKTLQEEKVLFILECCSVDGKKFSDEKFLQWTGTMKGEDAIRAMFKTGEISTLYDKISALSGYGKDAIEELKN
ncbi:MAG: hypothetical protein IJY52_00430 [Anaerotignum sp.]|nr:hypothetical protein [Anaerotignum sp.]